MLKIFFLIIFSVTFLYSNSSLILDNEKEKYDDFKVLYYKDKNSSLNVTEIKEELFKKENLNRFNLGYNKGTVWFKLKVKNISDVKEFVISINEIFYETANLYYYDENLNIVKQTNSIFNKIKDREIQTNILSFNVNIPKNQTITYYIELKGKYSYFGKITILKKETLHQQTILNTNSIFLFSMGALFIIVIFNLFLFIRIKEKIYLYYVGFSFFNLIYMLNISGFLVFIDLQEYIYDLQLSAAFMLGFLVLFSSEYLETKTYLSKYNNAIKSLSIIFFTLGILVVFSYQPWNKLINNFAGLLCIILIILSFIIYIKGHRRSIYYLITMVLYFISVIIFTFMVMGIIEYNNFTRYGFTIFSTLEVVIFSLMLSYRYSEIKEESEKLLEYKVKERTFELRNKYQQIKNLLTERELLLRELHHRVKNNFHTIIGLLWFEEQKNISEKNKFRNINNRIKSMSMIHELLYKNKDVSNIATKTYLENIINNVISSYSNIKVNLNCHIESLNIKFDYALSLGVIVNELLNNSLKHNINQNNLNLELHLLIKEQKIELSVKDNGNGFNIKKCNKGLGITIIENFAQKLPSVNYEFIIQDGVEFKLLFNKD